MIRLLLVMSFLVGFSSAYAQDTTNASQAIKKDSVVLKMMHFDDTIFKFQNIPKGQQLKHTFTFENKGKRAFKILDVQTGCHCTVTKWSKQVFQPGDKGEIVVQLDTRKAVGIFTKNVFVISTAENKEVVLKLKGSVI